MEELTSGREIERQKERERGYSLGTDPWTGRKEWIQRTGRSWPSTRREEFYS